MSIKVMTWVWDHSPAAGTELLLLLAIADQANDDGRDAWPSIKTLARRTRLDERTVRRVLKRLADSGQVVINSGGGRRSNDYEVSMTSGNAELSTPRGDCHPWQDATPGKPPGQTGQGAQAPRAQLCPGSPDTAVPYDPSYTRPLPLHPRAADERQLRVVPVGRGGGGDSGEREVLDGLGSAWQLTPKQRARLTPMIAAALEIGWTPAGLVEHLSANPDGVKSPAAVLAARLNDLPDHVSVPEQVAERPAWCGTCDEATRHRERDDGRLERCPSCHPRRATPKAPAPTRRGIEAAKHPRRAGPAHKR